MNIDGLEDKSKHAANTDGNSALPMNFMPGDQMKGTAYVKT